MYLGISTRDRLATISEIAEQFNIPKNHLMKVVNELGRLDYVVTVRGPGGGIRLARPPGDILLAQVIRDFEAILEPVNCEVPLCPIKGYCELKQALDKAQQAFFNVLEAYSLADLLEQPDSLQRLQIV